MEEHGMYLGKKEFYELIRKNGGAWNDAKERPIICLIKSLECDGLYWAIPVGNYEHRDAKAKERIQKYMDFDKKDIRSCFYHVGNTNENENRKPNSFRQHITDMKKYLINELNNDVNGKGAAD